MGKKYRSMKEKNKRWSHFNETILRYWPWAQAVIIAYSRPSADGSNRSLHFVVVVLPFPSASSLHSIILCIMKGDLTALVITILLIKYTLSTLILVLLIYRGRVPTICFLLLLPLIKVILFWGGLFCQGVDYNDRMVFFYLSTHNLLNESCLLIFSNGMMHMYDSMEHCQLDCSLLPDFTSLSSFWYMNYCCHALKFGSRVACRVADWKSAGFVCGHNLQFAFPVYLNCLHGGWWAKLLVWV